MVGFLEHLEQNERDLLLCGVEHSFLSLFADDVVLPPPSILRTKLLRPVSPFITDIPKRFLEIFMF